MPRARQFDEQAVLNKAMELFWKKGFHATSIQDLVEELGINRASLYATFGGKKELFERSLAAYRTRNIEWLPTFLSQHKTVKEGIFALFDTSIEDAVNDPHAKGCFVVNTTTEFSPNDEKLFAQITANKANFEQLIQTYLTQGVRQGEISEDQDLASLSAFIFTLYTGMRVVAKVSPDKASLKATVKAALTFFKE